MDVPLHHLDKRIVNRSKKKGLVTEEKIETYLASLPDRSDNVYMPEVEEAGQTAAEAVSSEPSTN